MLTLRLDEDVGQVYGGHSGHGGLSIGHATGLLRLLVGLRRHATGGFSINPTSPPPSTPPPDIGCSGFAPYTVWFWNGDGWGPSCSSYPT